MKNILLIFFLFLTTIIACSSTPEYITDFRFRRYRLCSDTELKNPIGKACFHYCIDYSFFGRTCKEWRNDILDLSDKEDFLKLRNAGFVLINEERL